MSLTTKLLLYLALNVFLICGAQAQTGQGILCDTEEQARAYAQAGGGHEGLRVVNAHSKVCAYMVVRFTEPVPVGTASMGSQIAGIVQLTINGYFAFGQWIDLAPSLQFILVPLGQGA